MKITIRTEGSHFSMPLPLKMAGFVIKKLPQHVFDRMCDDVPEPYRCLITKDYVCMIVDECMEVLRENKGLQVVQVEARDGTYVSIKL